MKWKKLLMCATLLAVIVVLAKFALGSLTHHLNGPSPAQASGPVIPGPQSIWATGKIEAWRQATVGAPVVGRVEAYVKKEGEVVEVGEPVVFLDRDALEADLRAALALREQARRDRDRQRSLLEDDVVSDWQWEDAETTYLVAEAEAAALKERTEERIVRAPFAGGVLKTYLEAGECVEPGTPLFVLGELSTLKIRCEVDELDLARVSVGQRALIYPDSHPDRVWEGRVHHMSGILGRKTAFSEDPRERIDAKVLEVEIRLEATPELLPGMTVKVEIKPETEA